MAVLCIQETHLQGYGIFSIQSNYSINYLLLLYYSRHQKNVNFKLISDRKCKITIQLKNSGNKLIIVNVYVSTLERSEKNPDPAAPTS